MKILYINKYHYLKGGAERAYFDTAGLFARAGHDLAFFSTRHPLNRPSRWQKYFLPEVDYDREHTLGQKIRAAAKIIWNREAKSNLSALVKNFRPEIAHLHNIYHQLSPSVIAALKQQAVPIVMTLHDYKLISPNYLLLNRGRIWEASRPRRYWRCVRDRCVKDSYGKSLVCALEAYLHHFFHAYGGVDAFISPSRFLIEKFREYGFSHDIIHLPNPLFFHPPLPSASADRPPYLLFFGRLSPEKGAADLLQALKLAGLGIRLVIAGDGPQKDQLRYLAADLKISPQVEFAGFCQGDDLWRLVGSATAVIVPSRWYENAPYTVLEAMALGRPVIASAIGGLQEMITDGQTGLLFEPGNQADLAQKISWVGNNPSAAGRLGEQARKSVLTKHEPLVYYRKLLDIYQALIQKKT
ncbi:hypothetical protein COX69_01755 [Candidatus Falkowbacteria bacterium CG_4_10_14_0_2_um_filter_48_10]|nr:MAG: hypothetical protein COX69_01755 [Candidatus Falkowbacteria bacterium CG_4_10_14_0_2_um_filter_48_10]